MSSKGLFQNHIHPVFTGTIPKTLGFVMFSLSLALLVPAGMAMFMGEDPMIYLIPVPPLMALGILMYVLFRPSPNFRSVNGLLMVGMAWILVFLIGAIPFALMGFNLLDSIFESVSGFTTTGATVIDRYEEIPYSMYIWRSLSQWIGGLMVILIFMYMLPSFGIGRNLFVNELSGSGSTKYSVKMTNAARSFIAVYMVLTALNLVCLLVIGTDPKESICLALTTISTGGMIYGSHSLMDAGFALRAVTLVFMLLGGLNFYIHFTAIFKRTLRAYSNNTELRLLLMWFLISSVIIYGLMVLSVPDVLGFDLSRHLELLFDSFFTTVSMGTTTGLYVVDFVQFPSACIFILFVVTFFGASGGSTSGGVKFSRLIILAQFIKNNVSRLLNPNGVYSVKVDGQALEDSAVMNALCILVLYLLTMFAGSAAFMLFGYGFIEAVGLSLSSITNVGLGFGDFGPNTSVAFIPPAAKTMMIVLMWFGRMEILMALTYFTPAFWREIWSSHRSKKRVKSLTRYREE